MRLLIVTADDLGLRPDVDEGIVRAHREGIVTHASWLAGGASAQEAAPLVQEVAPGLGVGLHLALSQTIPSGPLAPLAGLLTPEARFPPRQFSAILWARTRARREAVWNEWNAQADAFERTWGRTPTHLDSHQHVHLAPWLGPLAVRLAAERGIPRLRAPDEPARGRADTAVFSALGRRLARLVRASGVATPDHFDGYRWSGRLNTESLREMEAARGEGCTEWMTHPGTRDEPGGYQRLRELRSLAHVRTPGASPSV